MLEEFAKKVGRKNPFAGLPLESPEHLRAAFAIAQQVTTISPRLAGMFAADAPALLKDLGIRLGTDLQRRFSVATKRRPTDQKAYAALRKGAPLSKGGTTALTLRPDDRAAYAGDLRKSLHPERERDAGLSYVESLHAQFAWLQSLVPARPRRRAARHARDQEPRSSTGSARAALFALPPGMAFSTTGGHDVVLQVTEGFWTNTISTLVQDYWLVLGLLALFGVELPAGAFLPTHVATGRLFCFDFEVRLVQVKPPRLLLSDVHSIGAQVSFGCACEVRTRANSSEAWGAPLALSCSLVNTCNVAKRASGSFLGQALSEFFEADLANGEFAVIEPSTPVDPIAELLLLVAGYSMVRERLPGLPVSPELPDRRPFTFFDDADWSTLVGPIIGLGGDAWTVAWGPGTQTFTVPLVTDGHDLALGLSRAVFSFFAERGLPDIPAHDGSTHITSIGVEPRWGHIAVFGDGYVETCDCWPDESFSYCVRIGLEVSDDGMLTAKVLSTDVAATGVSAFLTRLLLPFLGTIIVGIAESLFGDEAAAQVQDSLNINLNIQEFFAQESQINPVQARVTGARITPNGIFFDGKLSLNFG